MRKMENSANVSGYVYRINRLNRKAYSENSKKFGQDYIYGEILVAIDEECTKTVPVTFSVSQLTSKGAENRLFSFLEKLMVNENTVEKVGKERAAAASFVCSVGVNDFVANNNDMVSRMEMQASWCGEFRGFGATFSVDTLIRSYSEKEVEDGENYGIVSGYVFDFRDAFLPVKFNISPEINGAMQYFEDMAKPSVLKIKGKIDVSTVIRQEESGGVFGSVVKSTPRSFRTWEIIDVYENCGEFGDEDCMTEEDVRTGMVNREIHLDEVRKRNEAKQAANNGSAFAAPSFSPSVNVPPAPSFTPASAYSQVPTFGGMSF